MGDIEQPSPTKSKSNNKQFYKAMTGAEDQGTVFPGQVILGSRTNIICMVIAVYGSKG